MLSESEKANILEEEALRHSIRKQLDARDMGAWLAEQAKLIGLAILIVAGLVLGIGLFVAGQS